MISGMKQVLHGTERAKMRQAFCMCVHARTVRKSKVREKVKIKSPLTCPEPASNFLILTKQEKR